MITDIKTMKANVLHIIILAIFSLTLTCCNKALVDNAVYAEDDASPVKSVRTPYIFQPVPLESVNGIVTVEENNDMPSTDTQHYNLVIINSKGEKKTVPFALDWDVSVVYDDDKIDDEIRASIDYTIDYCLSGVTINGNTRGITLRTNSSDEIYVEILGEENDKYFVMFYNGIIKFDKEGNLLLKKLQMTIDFTFSVDVPALSAPLDDGGYVLLYKRQEERHDEDDEYDEYDEDANLPYDGVTLRYYDGQGRFSRQYTVESYSKDALFYHLVKVGDNFFLVHDKTIAVLSQEGRLIKDIEFEEEFVHCFSYAEDFYFSSFLSSEEKYSLLKYDSNGDLKLQHVFQPKTNSAVLLNATTYHGQTLLSGYNLSNFVWLLHSNSFGTESNYDGLLLTISGNSEATENCLDSDNGLVLYAVIEKPDGSCTLYYDKLGISYGWQTHIYVYNIDKIEDLFRANSPAETENDSNAETDDYDY